MRIKTSITLPHALLEENDKAGRMTRELRDAQILNRNAERLNREAADVLEYSWASAHTGKRDKVRDARS